MVTCKYSNRDENTGLPVDTIAEDDIEVRAEEEFRHIYRAYPTVPSPYFSAQHG